MQKHPIDDLFGRNLEQASLKPSADAWARLQGRQGNQKRPVAMWWYASAAACLLLIGIAGWWVWRTNIDSVQNPAIAGQKVKPLPKVDQSLLIKKPYEQEVVDSDEHLAVASIESKLAKKTGSIGKPSPVLTKTPVEKAKPEFIQSDLTSNEIEVEPAVVAKLNPAPQREIVPSLPPAEERTLVVQLASPQEMSNKSSEEEESQNNLAEQTKKHRRTKVGRILRQLNNLREGEPIDWQEVGVQPGNLLAKASKTVEEGREKINDSYENIRSNAFKKNAEK